MTKVGIVNKCKLTPCLLQVFQGRYESSVSTNTVHFHFLNMNIAKRKQICLVTLVILLSRAGKWEMKCVICPLTVFRLVLCFENVDVLSAECRARRQSPQPLAPVFHPFQGPLLPTWGAALALGQRPSACTDVSLCAHVCSPHHKLLWLKCWK